MTYVAPNSVQARDIASVVAPDAAVKVFLYASPEERARRRAEETGNDYASELAHQRERGACDIKTSTTGLVVAHLALARLLHVEPALPPQGRAS